MSKGTEIYSVPLFYYRVLFLFQCILYPAVIEDVQLLQCLGIFLKNIFQNKLFETDSECIPRRLAAGLVSKYRETIPYVKIPCGICRRVLHPNKLPVIMFKPFSDFNLVAEFKAETSASSSVSSGLPVILLHKSSHMPCSPAICDICFEQV